MLSAVGYFMDYAKGSRTFAELDKDGGYKSAVGVNVGVQYGATLNILPKTMLSKAPTTSECWFMTPWSAKLEQSWHRERH
ncbi:hypothetical protein PG990_008944 [Apiospora arundinis]